MKVDLALEEDEQVYVLVRYKRLPDYCHDCGMIRHTKKECPGEDHNKDFDP